MQILAIIVAFVIAAVGGGLAVSNNSRSTPTPTAVIVASPTQTPISTPSVSISRDSSQSATLNTYAVVKVIDGDTIEVRISEANTKVRLIGIDTPETVDPRKPVQCFGKEASKRASDILLGKEVVLEDDKTQGDKDKYDRLLRYVFLSDGTNVNKSLIQEGYAHEYTYDLPYKYQIEFKQAQNDARDGNRGLWADNVCITPSPTSKPTSAIAPTNKPWSTSTPYPTTKPTVYIYIQPTSVPIAPVENTNSGYTCDCSKSCPNMASCEEAYFQLNQCGCSARDGDDDGIPCETICR